MTITDDQIATMTKALRAFGYSTVTIDFVRQESEKLLAGEEPTNVIGMFVKDWLKEAGLLKTK